MNIILETLTGMNNMTDQVIATDFLIAAKSLVRNYAIAITETNQPELRTVLRKQLNDAIITHEKIFRYMADRGYYNAYDIDEQQRVDLQVTDTALNLADTKLQ